MNKNKIIFLIGASGSGKTTIENRFLKEDSKRYGNFVHVVSHATRKKRVNEKDGVDYYFINDNIFDNIEKEKGFLQIIEHAGTKKGSSKMEWEERLTQGNIIMPVLLSSAIKLKKELIKIDNELKNNIHIVFLDISKKESLERIYERTLMDLYFDINDFKQYCNNYINGKIKEDNLPIEIKDIIIEISNRLNDINILKNTKKYTKHIIKVDGKSKDVVYNDFLQIIDNIFNS